MTLSLAVPSELTVGDTWSFTLSIPDYERPTWTATLYLRNSAANYSAASSGAGPDHAFSVPAATTSGYKAGKYHWQVRVSDGTTKVTVDEGWIDLESDPSASGVHDQRGWARRALDAVEATLEGRATDAQQSFQIRDRSLSRYSLDELRALHDWLSGKVREEEGSGSGGSGRRIKHRFQRG